MTAPLPPDSVCNILDKADGVYFVVKDKESRILWVNTNFAQLVGQTKEELIGSTDTRREHVEHDREVIKSGKPLYNLRETIAVPQESGQIDIPIVTQKGLWKNNAGDIAGITVCFSLDKKRMAPYWIERLKMRQIDLGGWFAEGTQSKELLPTSSLAERFKGEHRLYSTNYFLLDGDQTLELHSLNQDEIWYHHDGYPIRLHIFSMTEDGEKGQYRSIVLQQQSKEDLLQCVVPHNTWFGAELVDRGFALASCSLSPSWTSNDSILPDDATLEKLREEFPEQRDIIQRLSKRRKSYSAE